MNQNQMEPHENSWIATGLGIWGGNPRLDLKTESDRPTNGLKGILELNKRHNLMIEIEPRELLE